MVDLRTDGDISKEEFRTRRVKLETELQAAREELEEKSKPIIIPPEEKMRWKEIEQTLSCAIDFSGDRPDEEILDKFIRRVTPLGDNRYAFHMNLDKGISENLTARVGGRKGTAFA